MPPTSRTQPQQPATAASVQTRGTRSVLLTAALVSTLGPGSTGSALQRGAPSESALAAGGCAGNAYFKHSMHRPVHCSQVHLRSGARRPIGTNGRAMPHRPGPLRVVCRLGIRAQATRLPMWPHCFPMWPHPRTHVAYGCGPTRLLCGRPADSPTQAKQPPLPSTLPVDGPFSVARTHMHANAHTRTHAHTHRRGGGGAHSLRKTVSSWSRTKLESL